MAKAGKLSAAVVAGQESLSAAVAQVGSFVNPLDKAHGIIETGIASLRAQVDDLTDELALTKETADKTIFEMKTKYEQKIRNLEAQLDQYTRVHSAIKNELQKPLVNAG